MIDNLSDLKKYLAEYDGPDMNIMEVCGSHTAAISKLGIRSLVSDKIHLLSGPGCPVCVTPSAYIDKLTELSKKENTIICTFGDMIRVPGSVSSLADEKGNGAKVKMVYSPMDTLTLAKNDRENNYIFAAVGFETTTPVYALLIDTILKENIKNVKILTAIKTMPEVINYLLQNGAKIDGFIAPGHVSVITGTKVYEPIAKEYSIPFGVAGFKGPELLTAITGIVKNRNKGIVENYYPSVVRDEGNIKARNLIDKYFDKCDAVWRGMGLIVNSGRILKPEYSELDAGSADLNDDHKLNRACHCDEVLMGKITPDKCPLFHKVCTPATPQGACMVSTEGSCHAWMTL
ncbi:MAG: hydrogenase formation protein HypD [Catonella sp.]|nr:hydrogenase formation protein HypD [Catonella sp.]MDY6356609.1 hydrogenase formation protein HypD [Catonella sp.]